MNAHTRLEKPRLRPVSDKRIRAAVEAARKADIDVAGFEVSPDGTIRILGPAAFPAAPPKDAWEEAERAGLLD